ncbi:hypothetical protein [Paenibacillus pinihumi]|uniref:hypothetical protein n=1 Tax=Paenibacillus pinihumi TaxID=669462 RepID=UPI000411AC4B|nr:hypothetical protein [Paenibacillus pinihumi]
MIEQLELFDFEPKVEPAIIFTSYSVPALNGFYYETKTRKFVSFVLGQRYYEIPASRCRLAKEWQQKIMRERSI